MDHACKVEPEPARCLWNPSAQFEVAEPSERQGKIRILRQPHVRKPTATCLSFRASCRPLRSSVRRCCPGSVSSPVSYPVHHLQYRAVRPQRCSHRTMPGRPGFRCPRVGYRIGWPGTGTDIMPHMAPQERGPSQSRTGFGVLAGIGSDGNF